MIKIVQEGPVLDKMKEITGKVSKAGNTARNTVINTKNTVDYFKGNRDTRFSYDDKGTVRDVKNTALKAYASEAGDWKIDKDPVNGMLRVKFDAKKVSTNLANRVNPSSDRSDSLASYITGYDKGTNTVTMEVPLDGGSSAKKKAQKKLDKKKKESTDYDEFESVMTPTPVPYKGEVCDKDGKLVKKESLTLKTESEDLLETPGLTLSVPEVVTSPKSGDSLVIKINGKEYKYVLPETSDKSVSDIARTVTGIQKHSEGRALAYLKKNMKLVKENIKSDDDEEVIKSIVRDVNKKNLDRDSEEYINQIESELKKKNISVDADQLGSIIVGLDESLDDPTMTTEEVEDFYSKELSEGNSFKDSHICQGCGKPLSQCTCDVDTKEEDIDFDNIEECTQPSSVGQYKSDSIDLINEDIISEDSLINKDLVKNLMSYSKDEISKAVNQISNIKSSYKKLDKRFTKLTGPNTGTFPDGHPWMSLYLISNDTEISLVTSLEENSDDIYVTVDYNGEYYSHKSFDFYTDLDSAIDLANALADKITDDMSETSVAKVCEDLGLIEV